MRIYNVYSTFAYGILTNIFLCTCVIYVGPLAGPSILQSNIDMGEQKINKKLQNYLYLNKHNNRTPAWRAINWAPFTRCHQSWLRFETQTMKTTLAGLELALFAVLAECKLAEKPAQNLRRERILEKLADHGTLLKLVLIIFNLTTKLMLIVIEKMGS